MTDLSCSPQQFCVASILLMYDKHCQNNIVSTFFSGKRNSVSKRVMHIQVLSMVMQIKPTTTIITTTTKTAKTRQPNDPTQSLTVCDCDTRAHRMIGDRYAWFLNVCVCVSACVNAHEDHQSFGCKNCCVRNRIVFAVFSTTSQLHAMSANPTCDALCKNVLKVKYSKVKW